MNVKFNKDATDIKQSDDKDDISVLLTLAKNGDKAAKELLIKKYYALIVFQTKGIYLNGYTFDNLVQTGIESALKSINSFNMNKGIEAFSLITIVKDYMESIDFIPDTKILEEVIVKTITLKELLSSPKLLDKEELELIKFLYLNDETSEKNIYQNMQS